MPSHESPFGGIPAFITTIPARITNPPEVMRCSQLLILVYAICEIPRDATAAPKILNKQRAGLLDLKDQKARIAKR